MIQTVKCTNAVRLDNAIYPIKLVDWKQTFSETFFIDILTSWFHRESCAMIEN